MMSQHVEIVEKLWARQKEQDEEIRFLRDGGKVARILNTLLEVNI